MALHGLQDGEERMRLMIHTTLSALRTTDAETEVLLLRFVRDWMDAYHPRELAAALEAAKTANLI